MPNTTNTYIAFLKGINVGGKNCIKMPELIRIFSDLGLKNVKTYIQSGNIIFQTTAASIKGLADTISHNINRTKGIKPYVHLILENDLQTIVSKMPFTKDEHDVENVHFYFLETIPESPDLEILENLKSKTEQFQLIEKTFYLYAPDGIGRSKLAKTIETALKTTKTARNWNTVNSVLKIAME